MRISEVVVVGLVFGIIVRCKCISPESGSSNGTHSFGSYVDGSRNYASLGTDDHGGGKLLSRKRRFLAFPLGSSFSVAACMNVGVIGNPNTQYLSWGLNWGVAYDLPNSTWVLQNAHGFGKKGETPEPVVKRRSRRDLYQKLELIIDSFLVAILSSAISLDPENSEHELYLNQTVQLGPNQYTRRSDSLVQIFAKEKYKLTEGITTQKAPVRRRRKRFVAFPEGASFTCAVCATVGVVGSPSYNYLSYGLNWGVAYDLPNKSWVLQHLHGFGSKPEPLAIAKRRNRRTLYRAIERTVDSMGYNGRDCVLRTLCESKSYFRSEKLGMIPELLRTIFTMPKTRLFSREIRENADIVHYNHAYFSDEDEDCEFKYPCSFSLLELGMGKYSVPDTDYYEN